MRKLGPRAARSLLLAAALAAGCSTDWPMFRQNQFRMAFQANITPLTDPSAVGTLHVAPGWPFQPAGAQGFRASPVVWKGRVYVGNGNGRFYAVDAVTGGLVWQYPPPPAAALTTQYLSNPSSRGIASSAAVATIGGVDAVIIAAPDQSIGAGLGSGRLFALNAATGAEIWKSPELARLTGLTWASTTELHEQHGYSSPVVWGNLVYVGIANHGDNPIQNGRVVAVDLATGAPAGGFGFSATSTRGGGVWSSVAAGAGGLFVTTGNARCWNGGCQGAPAVDHSLSLLRLDQSTGAVDWKLKPVPFAMDDDPDLSAGAAVMSTSCGTLVASTMKDGWTYAVEAGSGPMPAPAVRWQFPPTGLPFAPGDGTVHGDSRYLRPGAAWGDVFITTGGGWEVTTATGLYAGYSRLHALNACATDHADRVRWIADIPGVSGPYSLGPPTVSCGIVFVGTSAGRLLALADPSVAPATGARCSHPSVPAASCVAAGFKLVPIPAVLASVQLDGSIQTEPALARGRVYVSTDAGKLYMLEP
jgi:outer membrane protein assembly factor BamB